MTALDRLKAALGDTPKGWRGPPTMASDGATPLGPPSQKLVSVFADDLAEVAGGVISSPSTPIEARGQVIRDLLRGATHRLSKGQSVAVQADDLHELVAAAGGP